MNNYFNTKEYFNYLIKNFDFVNRSDNYRDETCKRPDIDLIFKYINYLDLQPGNAVLEIGCGLGRLLNSLVQKHGVIVSGIDVSVYAVDYAKQHINAPKKDIRCGDAEALPFDDASFDFVICWAVFDLTNQEKSLIEMLRVLKPGGKILLTGKNDTFLDDDEDAYIAEIKSREKNIPNHYTNYNSFINVASMNGGEFILQHFFLRRGDFMKGLNLTSQPDKFIEYCVIIKKNKNLMPKYIKVAEKYSQTWRKRNGK